MEEIEGTSALYRVHPGAIHLHQGESFLVRDLDLDAGHAILEPVEVDYYTQPREVNDVRVFRSWLARKLGAASASLGEVRVTQQVIGYRRVQQFREEVLSVEDLDLPVQTFDTVALWWDVPRPILARVDRQRLDPAGGCTPSSMRPLACCPCSPCATAGTSAGCRRRSIPTPARPRCSFTMAFPAGWGSPRRALSSGGPVAGNLRSGARLSLRGRVPELCTKPQVRQQQRTAGQAGGCADFGRDAQSRKRHLNANAPSAVNWK